MADVPSSLYSWSTTTGSNSPSSTTAIGAGLAPNLQEIQGAVRRALSHKGSDIAASSTTDLGAVDGLMHNITGTATITSFGTIAAGVWKVICFQGTPTITYNGTSMITPGGISITAAVNDIAIVQSLGSGNWRFVSYTKASGLPVVNPTVTGPFADSAGIIKNASDATKISRLRADNLTTATTRNIWLTDEEYNAGASWVQNNMSVTVTAAANAMTIAWKDKAGADFSATNPLIGKFRSATSTSGLYTAISVTGAFSITIPSSATLGTANGVAHRIYFGRANNAGVVQPFVYNPVAGVTHSAIRSQFMPSATAISASATSAQTYYSSSAFTTCPIIIDGYFESSQTTAGTWASSPTYVHLLRPGDNQSGDIIQEVFKTDGSYLNNGGVGAVIPYDNTIPQSSEGWQVLSQAVTPRNAANIVRVTSNVIVTANAGDDITYAIFNGGSNALSAAPRNTAANEANEILTTYVGVVNTAASLTWTTRIGCNTPTVLFVNGTTSAQRFGGISSTWIEIKETFV